VPGGRYDPEVSTRRLILTALLCGLAILVAFTVQVVLLPR
jgi:hypothetical protein